MCRSGPGRPDGAVSRLCPTPRRGGASRTRKPRATAVGLGWPAEAKGEPRSSRPRPSAPQPPATQPNIVGPPRRWVSAVSSPHLPLFIILREIQREIFLRREEGRQKERKSGSREMRRRGRGGEGIYVACAWGVHAPRTWHIPPPRPRRRPLTALESHWNQAQCKDPTPSTGIKSAAAALNKNQNQIQSHAHTTQHQRESRSG